MDKVFIQDLKVDAVIGVFEWEKQIQQPLHFDIEMQWDNRPAAQTDDLAYALDYAAVSESVIQFVKGHQFELLETLLEQLSQQLLHQFKMPSLTLRVEKPAVVPEARAVGIEITRSLNSHSSTP